MAYKKPVVLTTGAVSHSPIVSGDILEPQVIPISSEAGNCVEMKPDGVFVPDAGQVQISDDPDNEIEKVVDGLLVRRKKGIGVHLSYTKGGNDLEQVGHGYGHEILFGSLSDLDEYSSAIGFVYGLLMTCSGLEEDDIIDPVTGEIKPNPEKTRRIAGYKATHTLNRPPFLEDTHTVYDPDMYVGFKWFTGTAKCMLIGSERLGNQTIDVRMRFYHDSVDGIMYGPSDPDREMYTSMWVPVTMSAPVDLGDGVPVCFAEVPEVKVTADIRNAVMYNARMSSGWIGATPKGGIEIRTNLTALPGDFLFGCVTDGQLTFYGEDVVDNLIEHTYWDGRVAIKYFTGPDATPTWPMYPVVDTTRTGATDYQIRSATVLQFVPTNPAKPNFLGWTTVEGSSTVEYNVGDRPEFEVREDLILYAVYGA